MNHFWGSFKKQAAVGKGIPSFLGTLTGVKDVHRGYKAIAKGVKAGKILESGATTTQSAAKVKGVAGKAMAGGLGRMVGTGALIAHMTKDKDGGQAQGY